MKEISLQEKIDIFKAKLETLLSDEYANPSDVLKASQDLDELINEFYRTQDIVAN